MDVLKLLLPTEWAPSLFKTSQVYSHVWAVCVKNTISQEQL